MPVHRDTPCQEVQLPSEPATRNEQVEALWHQLNARLRQFICARVSDCDAADDLLQDVFLRIHSHIDTLRQQDRLQSWVYQIARNAIVDYYRSQRPTSELSETLVEEPDIPDGEDAAMRLASGMREMVEALPEPYRQALLLTEFEGLSQRELADRVGISLSGAKSRVQRARLKVRDMLLECCHLELDRRGAVIDYYERCCCCAEESRRN